MVENVEEIRAEHGLQTFVRQDLEVSWPDLISMLNCEGKRKTLRLPVLDTDRTGGSQPEP